MDKDMLASLQANDYWSSYRTLREDAVPLIFPFDAAGGTKAAHRRLLCRSSPLKDRNSGSGSLENDSAGVSDSTTADCDQTLNFGEEDPESLESGSASLMLNQVAVLEGRLREAAEENRQLKKALQKAMAGNATPIHSTHSPQLSSILLTCATLKVWMTIVESGWNVWVWLSGGGCG